jgi:hypothetical protein
MRCIGRCLCVSAVEGVYAVMKVIEVDVRMASHSRKLHMPVQRDAIQARADGDELTRGCASNVCNAFQGKCHADR